MHRLLKLQGAYLHKYSRKSFSVFNTTTNYCLLCKLNNNIFEGSITFNSTNANPNVKFRKRRKGKREYAELLMVSDNSSCQRRANVKKLSFNDLELLATTNLNLSELYKLKELSQNATANEYTYNNLNLIDISPSSESGFLGFNISTNNEKVVDLDMPNMNLVTDKQNVHEKYTLPVEEIFDNAESNNAASQFLEQEDELDSIKIVNTFQPEGLDDQVLEIDEVKDPPETLEKPKVKDKQDYRRREEIVSNTLAAFVEVCEHLKNPQRGLTFLNFHRFKTKKINNKSYIPIKSANVYNGLLKGFAHKGTFTKMKEILTIMEEEGVQRTVQTYIAIFECLARLDKKEKDIKKYVNEALAQNFTFDKIMNEGIFLNNERELVLKTIRQVDENYVPKFKYPEVVYNNHLVNSLNHPSQMQIPDIDLNEVKGMFTTSKLEELVDKQINLEKEGYIIIKSIDNKGPVTEEVLKNRISLEEHYKMWEDEALKAFNRDLATLTAQRSATNMEPFIRSIPAKDCIAIIIEEAKKIAQGSETYSPTVNMLYKDLGSKVYARYKILRKNKCGILDKTINIHKGYCKRYAASHKSLGVLPEDEVVVNSRQAWQGIEYQMLENGATLDMDHQKWVPSILTFIGKFLYHIVMYDLKIDVNVLRNSKHKNYLPAFYTIFRTQGRIVKEEVKPHPILSKLYRQSNPETLTFPSYEVPMMCPPVPWVSTQIGGYLISPCDIIRLPVQATIQTSRLSEVGIQQIYPSLDVLNQLASVPWKVNTKILDVILEVFNNGGSAELDIPEDISSLKPPPQSTPEMDKAQRYELFKQKMQYRRKKAEMYSLWCDCLYKLSLANHFRNDIFWLPHNMDFRGRVYPVPPHLNHLGSDLARSMLVFAEPRPLGPNGLDWLKIHLINLTGLKKKESIQKRLDYANEILHLIFDSADNPLNGKRWWSQSDEPWQTLACCMEIADVIRSGDTENYKSHFPVHQDGSCNGLQHYAALGRDANGAFSVNLAHSDTPQDVYSAVVSLVEKQRFIDAENGNETAKALEGFVKRKVIKQTIMTTVYGVTRYGAKHQIARQLKDIDDFPKDLVWAAASYLTGRTFDSLRTMFTSTREIQDWFTECARLISSVGGKHVEWVTPLGLPIVQPYYKYRKTCMGGTYESYAIDKYEKPNVMKQKNAFPPNFIHSLDSCHMMLTSLYCERAGITFVSVHDCFWTHPSTVHIMNKICREQFVALHSEPILENLSEFLCDNFSCGPSEFSGDGSVRDLTKKKLNRILRQLPKTGDFDINQVLKSVYFFS